MTQWFKENTPWFILIVVAFFSGHFLLLPKLAEPGVRLIPHIVTQVESVTVTPKWLSDSLAIWRARKTTTDTFQLVRTVFLSPAPVEDTSKLWLVVGLNSSTTVDAITQRGNRLARSILDAPGPLIGVYADTLPSPKLQFGNWPVYHQSTLSKILEISSGFALCKVTERL